MRLIKGCGSSRIGQGGFFFVVESSFLPWTVCLHFDLVSVSVSGSSWKLFEDSGVLGQPSGALGHYQDCSVMPLRGPGHVYIQSQQSLLLQAAAIIWSQLAGTRLNLLNPSRHNKI